MRELDNACVGIDTVQRCADRTCRGRVRGVRDGYGIYVRCRATGAVDGFEPGAIGGVRAADRDQDVRIRSPDLNRRDLQEECRERGIARRAGDRELDALQAVAAVLDDGPQRSPPCSNGIGIAACGHGVQHEPHAAVRAKRREAPVEW